MSSSNSLFRADNLASNAAYNAVRIPLFRCGEISSSEEPAAPQPSGLVMLACLWEHLPLAKCPEAELAQVPTTLLGPGYHEAETSGTLSMVLAQGLSGLKYLGWRELDVPRDTS